MQNSDKNDNISQLSTSSPILSDTLCRVCQDRHTGVHYGVYTCNPCREFFRRCQKSKIIYKCNEIIPNQCIIDSTSRKQCPSCRLKRCFKVGMQSKPRTQDSVLHNTRCAVCNDHCSGQHFGAYTCDACGMFFLKYAHSPKPYVCNGNIRDECIIDSTSRNNCKSCRLKRCFEVGMQSKPRTQDSVLHNMRCAVCNDHCSGTNYGAYTCDACGMFFSKYAHSPKPYVCNGNIRDECIIDSTSRNNCKSCRLKRCFEVGMQSKPRTQVSVLHNMRCAVCNDHCSGRNNGAYTCNACRQFFSRYAHSPKPYVCTGNFPDQCRIDCTRRKKCKSCRLKRCFEVGMKINAKAMPIPAAPHTSVDFTSVPPTYVPVVLPSAPSATNESLEHITVEKVSNNIECINGDLHERESMTTRTAPCAPTSFRSTTPSPPCALDLRMHRRTLSQEPGLIHTIPLATSESIQDSAAQRESITTLTAVCASPGLEHPPQSYVLDLRVQHASN